MSNIFIRNVVGSGTFAVPVDDTALANATVGLAGVLSGVAGLAVGRVLAWVETTGAGGATRVLNCLAEGFTYNA